MRRAEQARISEDEYLELERRSEAKHELVNGVIIAMAGSTREHSAITANVMSALKTRLRTLCFPRWMSRFR
jgi:Uma2 family endonuclease